VGQPGTARVGGGVPSHRRRGQAGAPQPSLERADRRHRVVGELVAEHHADQAGPPSGMVATQVNNGLDERFGGLGRRGAAPVVGGNQHGRITTTATAQEMPDGTRNQTEGLGDGGAILALLVAPPDGLAHRQGDRARHGPFSREDADRGIGPQCISVPTPRQNFVSQFHGKTSCRVTPAHPYRGHLDCGRLDEYRPRRPGRHEGPGPRR
jgi:hypothetical protein